MMDGGITIITMSMDHYFWYRQQIFYPNVMLEVDQDPSIGPRLEPSNTYPQSEKLMRIIT